MANPSKSIAAVRTAIVTVAIVLMRPTHSARGDLSSFPICTQGADQHHAAVSGNWVVWLDSRNGHAYPDIYGKDLSTGQEVVISTGGTTYNYWPGLDGDIVVWADNRSGNWDVYGLDLALYRTFGFDPSERQKCEFPICVKAGNQVQPTVSGHTVVWIGGDADVHGRYLLSGTEFTVCVTAIAWRPEISGRTVVWVDDRRGNKDVYGRRLYTSEADFPICTHPAEQDAVSVDGDRVVWHDNRNGLRDIYGFDFSSGTEFSICLNAANQWRPRISGEVVVWHDERNMPTGMAADIYGYDLAAGSEFAVCVRPGTQRYPAVSGRLVVWEDGRNGNLDIYGALVPDGEACLAPVITGCQASAAYDPSGHQGYSAQSIGPDAVLVGGTLALADFQLTDEYATIRMYYNQEEVLGAGIKESSLRLYWWSESEGSWLLAGNPSNLTDNSMAPDFQGFVAGWPTHVLGDWGLNIDENYVWANVDHASVFSIAGIPETATFSLLALGSLVLLRRRHAI